MNPIFSEMFSGGQLDEEIQALLVGVFTHAREKLVAKMAAERRPGQSQLLELFDRALSGDRDAISRLCHRMAESIELSLAEQREVIANEAVRQEVEKWRDLGVRMGDKYRRRDGVKIGRLL